MLIAVGLFALATVVVVAVGPRMARTADDLSEVTGLGGAMFGVVFLALATDLPEIALIPTAVLTDSPRIAVGGLLGSAAAQLTLIAVVDIFYRDGVLLRRVSPRATLGQAALMMAVLAVPLLAAVGSPTMGGVGLGTIVLPLAYLAALAAIRELGSHRVVSSPAPSVSYEEPGAQAERPAARVLWRRFGVYAALLAGAGILLESTTGTIGSAIGLEETAAGALLAGVVTSLPELVTAVSAARAGALELAVGDLVGSSALDVALLAVADAFYTDGSIFDLITSTEAGLIGVNLAVTALVVFGVAGRESQRERRVGVESYLMLAVYAAGAVNLVAAGR